MKTFIVPALICAKNKVQTLEEIAKELGYSVETLQSCLDQCDLNSNLPVAIKDLNIEKEIPRAKAVANKIGTKTIKEIAAEAGVSERTISRDIKKQGLKSQYTKPSLSELFEHRTLSDIAKYVKIDIERLKQILR